MVKQVELTPLAISVLALLDERPMHPYEMYQLLLSRREDYLVKIRPGSLYHTVAKLAEQGLARAEGTDRSGNRPERTIYRSTEAGTAALRSRIAAIIRRPVREYSLFPLAMSEAHNLPADEVVTLLHERIGLLDNEIAEIDAVHAWLVGNAVPRRYWMVIEYLAGQIRAEASWLRGVVADLREGTLPWEQFAPDGTRIGDSTGELGADWGASLPADIAIDPRLSPPAASSDRK
ncbi:PadR family transcriptional regulator [Nocardia terpenica]|uniref:PadR family transcriptional regulator n=1 Tax=Nocardia terpenica TaxID=455432 RepID=A0A6G9ZA53_9NOCA|nr:PadR family transcriptional regulator [Nocardia terpenica]QIS22475.1 PadR family transcriptional regulator [Nocardia terpenica]